MIRIILGLEVFGLCFQLRQPAIETESAPAPIVFKKRRRVNLFTTHTYKKLLFLGSKRSILITAKIRLTHPALLDEIIICIDIIASLFR